MIIIIIAIIVLVTGIYMFQRPGKNADRIDAAIKAASGTSPITPIPTGTK